MGRLGTGPPQKWEQMWLQQLFIMKFRVSSYDLAPSLERRCTRNDAGCSGDPRTLGTISRYPIHEKYVLLVAREAIHALEYERPGSWAEHLLGNLKGSREPGERILVSC
jgi:hypothetical protein